MRLAIFLLPCLLAAEPGWMDHAHRFGSGVSFLPAAQAGLTPANWGGLVAPPEPPRPSVTVRFSVIPLEAARATTGERLGYADYRAHICNGRTVPVVVPAERVLNAFPLPYLPDEYAERVLAAATERKRSPWSVAAGAVEFLGSGAVATGIGGVWATGTTNQYVAGIGAALQVGIPVVRRLVSEQRDASPVYRVPNPLPARIALGPGECAAHNFLGGIGETVIAERPIQ